MSSTTVRPRLAAVGRLAALQRHHPEQHEQISAAKAHLATEQIAEYVAKVVAAAPPLSPAQRDRLAVLLRSGKA